MPVGGGAGLGRGQRVTGLAGLLVVGLPVAGLRVVGQREVDPRVVGLPVVDPRVVGLPEEGLPEEDPRVVGLRVAAWGQRLPVLGEASRAGKDSQVRESAQQVKVRREEQTAGEVSATAHARRLSVPTVPTAQPPALPGSPAPALRQRVPEQQGSSTERRPMEARSRRSSQQTRLTPFRRHPAENQPASLHSVRARPLSPETQ